jgi:Cu2+-exporting ATPase
MTADSTSSEIPLEPAQAASRARTAECCAFCDLPVPSGATPRSEAVYCCYGCSFAAAISGGGSERSSDGNAANWHLARVLIGAFFAMSVMVFSTVLYASAVFDPEPGYGHALGPLAGIFRVLALLFATPAIVLLGAPLVAQSLPSAWIPKGWRRGVVATGSAVNTLVVLGATAAWVLSIVHVVRGEGEIYVETAVMLLLLLTLGRYLEANARAKARRSLRGLAASLPATARRLGRMDARKEFELEEPDALATANARAIKSVPIEVLTPGDVIRIDAGEVLSVDGTIFRGVASVDTSMVSGESDSRPVGPGDELFAGSLPIDGSLDIVVRARAGERLVDRLAAIVDRALATRPRIEVAAERVSAWFLRAVLVISIATLAYWWNREGSFAGIRSGLAVLLVACPCALGIAAPLAVTVGIQRAARRGILIRDGRVFESLARGGHAFFDKTGTLTRGELEVSRVVALAANRTAAEVMGVARALAAHSTHPVARALSAFSDVAPGAEASVVEGTDDGEPAGTLGDLLDCEVTSTPPRDPSFGDRSSDRVDSFPRSIDEELEQVEVVPGRGVVVTTTRGRFLLGNARLLSERGVDADAFSAELAASRKFAEKAPVFVVEGARVLGAVVLRESLRPEAKAVIEKVCASGYSARILTGDVPAAADDVARALGIPAHASLLPDEKVAHVEKAASPGRITLMVGDGLNDAPVLASATVGVTLADASDLARESADVVLLDRRAGRPLEGLGELLDLSRDVTWRIRINLAGAFGYNSIGTALAALGYIHPIIAAILMIVSSLTVVAISSSVGGNGIGNRATASRPSTTSNEPRALARARSVPAPRARTLSGSTAPRPPVASVERSGTGRLA